MCFQKPGRNSEKPGRNLENLEEILKNKLQPWIEHAALILLVLEGRLKILKNNKIYH